ncbi:membrane-spanning 4-domains subfamily A member 4A-like [Lissotriton helveticus]
MAAPPGNGMYVVTQYIPYANFNPTQQPSQQGVSPTQRSYFLKRFIEGEPKTLGAIQMVIGILQIFLGAFLCALPQTRDSIFTFTGVSFWTSIFYIISGALSVATERIGTLSLVKGSLGMNIVSTSFAGIEIIIASIDLGVDPSSRCPYGFCNAQKPIVSVLLILSLLEFSLGLSTSVFGCKSICCSGNTMDAQPMLAVQHNYPVHFGSTAGQPAGMPVPYTVSPTPDAPQYHGEAQVQRLPTAPEITTPPTYYMNCLGDGIQS